MNKCNIQNELTVLRVQNLILCLIAEEYSVEWVAKVRGSLLGAFNERIVEEFNMSLRDWDHVSSGKMYLKELVSKIDYKFLEDTAREKFAS